MVLIVKELICFDVKIAYGKMYYRKKLMEWL